MEIRTKAYRAIEDYYGMKRADRSGVLCIQHINKGLMVLDEIGSSVLTKDAYYIHPLLQSDSAFECVIQFGREYTLLKNYEVDFNVVALAMEYRRCANSFLSDGNVKNLAMWTVEHIREMLIADKIQNYTDFLIHHKATHANAERLERYFKTWLDILGINSVELAHLQKLIS